MTKTPERAATAKLEGPDYTAVAATAKLEGPDYTAVAATISAITSRKSRFAS
jgi:hypothetical protein